jgi:hypothetical protein
MPPKQKSSKPLRGLNISQSINEPEDGLPLLIRLANMVPAGTALPHFPDNACVRLGEDYLKPEVKEREFERFLNENFPVHEFREFRSFLNEGADHPFRPSEMYTFVRETREALRMIVTHQKERSAFSVTFHFPWEKVGDWDIGRIRLCENCGTLFLASRNNKLTCSDRCSTARRVREWRKHQAQYEQARKNRSARKDRRSKKLIKRREGNGKCHS